MAASDHGVVVIDKPVGATSHDVVQWVRWALHERAVGHCGTLDPAATGVLVVCVGEATKLVEALHAADKRYRGVIALGTATTTGDAEGEPIAQVELSADELADATVRAAAHAGSLCGPLSLAPPAFSAIKQDGVAAHVRARRGEAVELAPRIMRIDEVRVLGCDRARGHVEVELAVGKGTYVRAWAEALGAAIGIPAHLAVLRRLASGSFTLDAALGGLTATRLPTREARKPRVRLELDGSPSREAAAARLRAAMIDPVQALPWPCALAPDAARFERLCQGLPQWAETVGVEPDAAEGPGAVRGADGRLVLVRLAAQEGSLRVIPTRVLHLPGPPVAPAGHP